MKIRFDNSKNISIQNSGFKKYNFIGSFAYRSKTFLGYSEIAVWQEKHIWRPNINTPLSIPKQVAAFISQSFFIY